MSALPDTLARALVRRIADARQTAWLRVDDVGAARLARDVSRKIEETMQYPGEIRVTVVRETRASATAH